MLLQAGLALASFCDAAQLRNVRNGGHRVVQSPVSIQWIQDLFRSFQLRGRSGNSERNQCTDADVADPFAGWVRHTRHEDVAGSSVHTSSNDSHQTAIREHVQTDLCLK